MTTKDSDTLLNIKDLHVVYKTDLETVRAVNGIDLELQNGQTLGLVGETGAGKTTTALSILRLLPHPVGQITAGQILWRGQDILGMREAELRALRGEKISMVFQDPMTALDPIMSVGNQIKEALVLHNHQNLGSAELDLRVDQILEMVGISASRKKDYPMQFSGGMKQRVVIAIALACSPELLIADEPTTALDVTIQAQVLSLVKQLKDELNTSMLLITHDLGVVAQTCDIVAVMYAGEILERGTVYDLFSGDVHHPYTVGLFGSIPNMAVRTERLTPIDGLMPDPTNLPVGCAFSPRCPHCMEICKEQKPKTITDGTHSVKCFLFDKGVTA